MCETRFIRIINDRRESVNIVYLTTDRKKKKVESDCNQKPSFEEARARAHYALRCVRSERAINY